MTEQKPKIDLKARLGKKTTAGAPAAGGSIPPPVAASSPSAAAPAAVPGGGLPSAIPGGPAPAMRPAMQRPSAAPAVSPSGIPAPPSFGGGAASSPFAGASNPYAAQAAQPAPVAAKPQAIRIEMGEEVVEAQRRGRKKVAVLAAVTAIVGGVIGFAAGGGAERAKGAEAAVVGAQDLIKEIGAANAEVQKLADTVKSAKEKLGKGQYPEEEVSKLGGINIPFTGKNLAGKGIGRFRPEIVTMLIEYANSTTEANSQKEKLQNVLSGTKKGILELLGEPKVRWGVVLGNGPNGPWGSMQPLPAAFGPKEKWPDDIKVGSGKEQSTLKRYASGNPINNDAPFFVPVDPSSQSSVCPADVVFKLRRELSDLESVLRGDNTPGEDRKGLLESGQQLTNKLKQIGKES
ncbi:MAG TPA: hypothetical protein VFQ61_37520 [Polyangiaceae bacterium]|nr:hypothetical protein [Polyangiaceae bacterium]